MNRPAAYRPRSLASAASVMALAAGSAFGQAWNVDFSVTSGVGAGAPSSSFGAAAGTPGTWNNVLFPGMPQTHTLTDTAGIPTQLTLTRTPFDATSFTSASDTDLSGSTVNLLCDGQSAAGGLTYKLENLPTGRYAFYVYAGRPASTGTSQVVVGGSDSPNQLVGGNPTSNDLISGTTYSVHVYDQQFASNPVFIHVNSGSGTAYCAGIQIKKIGAYNSDARARIYVDDSISGTNDGGSWATAYNDLQTALQAARNMGASNAEIWTAQGFYYPTTGTSRSATFDIPSGLFLYGGFSATETSLEQREFPELYITAMSGSIGGSSQTDNSYNVITMNNVSSATIDGFSIARGYANGSGVNGRGGGASLTNSSPTFRKCKFLSNFASGDGGGVLNTGGFPDFVDCLFYDNFTDGSGAAMYAHTAGYPYFVNCEFIDNQADGDGGACKLLFTQGEFTSCLFNHNIASLGSGGAIAIAGDSGDDVEVTNCTIAQNIAPQGAGGVFINNDTDCYLSNSILWGNTGNSGYDTDDQQRSTNSTAGYIINSTTIQGLSSDPLFTDANGPDNTAGNFDDNFRLLPASPCIDAADLSFLDFDFFDVDGDAVTLEFLPFDVDGKNRYKDDPTESNSPSALDRGCYEFQPPCKPDWNNDATLDAFDYDDFTSDYFNFVNNGIGSADYNDDSVTDAFDYDDFVSDYFNGC